MKISVIMPAKNAEKTIRKSLQHVYNQDLQPYEIIVVDGGSKDETREIAASLKAKVIQEPPHEGSVPAIGRNYGAEIAKGDIYAFLDPDCFPEKTWLNKVAETLSNSKVGIYCVIVRDGKGTTLSRAWHYLQMQIEYDFAPTRCMAVRKEAFNAVKGFDERLPAGEDNDFSYRVKQLGYNIIIDKKTLVPHDDDHASSLKGIIHLNKWYHQGGLLMRQKWPEKFRKFKTTTPLVRNHVLPIIKSVKEEGPAVAFSCLVIKMLSVVKHV